MNMKATDIRVRIRALLTGLMLAGSAMLFSQAPAFATQASETRKFDIQPQSLASALIQFSKQANRQVVGATDAVRTHKTSGVSGDLTVSAALDKLLRGTGLKYQLVGERSVRIVPGGAQAMPVSTTAAGNDGGALRLVQAQDADPKMDESSLKDERKDERKVSETESGELVVTGSRLRGTSTSTASPITVITQEDIKRQGLNSVEDIIRSLPQSFSDVNAAAALDNSINTGSARGHVAANLRGFGAENTLVLVDGRRRVNSPSFFVSAVDVNSIPSGAIERVEILLDGASAIYGSDAAGGVINFILKKNYRGAETSISYENSSTGGDSYTANQLAGLAWGSGSVTGNVRYAKFKPINGYRMGVPTVNFTNLGGRDQRSTLLTQPGNVAGLGSLPAGDDGTNGIAGKLSPSNTVPRDTAATYKYQDFVADAQNLTFNVDIRQNISRKISLYANVTHSNNKSSAQTGPPVIFFVAVPPTNRFNDSGSTLSVNYTFDQEVNDGLLRPGSISNSQSSTGGLLGFKADLPFKDWTADLSGSRSRDRDFYFTLRGDTALIAERAAGVDAQGSPLPAAEHLNLFGNGTAQDPAALDGLVAPGTGAFAEALQFANAQSVGLVAEGSLFTLPGGAVRLAVGAEQRTDDLDYSKSAGFAGVFGIATPKRSINAEYMEASIPVVGEQNRIPGLYAVDLSMAARSEKYSFSGPFDGPTLPSRDESFNATSPKIGVAWYPVRDIKFRATWGKSFRAPDLYPLFSPESGPYYYAAAFGISDPQNPGDAATFDPPFYFGGNPGLQPETSRNTAIGLDWKPSGVLHGLNLSVTYSKIDFSNEISSTSTLLAFVGGHPDAFFGDPRLAPRDSNNKVTRINLKAINIAARNGASYDFKATYDFDTATVGAFTLGADGTYNTRLENVFFPGATPSVVLGTESGPEKLRMRGWVNWTRGNYGANVYVNYSGSYYNTLARSFPGLDGSVDSYTTVDLTGSYRMDAVGLEFNGGIKDLFDAKFPFFDGFGVPWDPRRVDLRRRMVYLNIVKKFDFVGSR